MLISSSQPQRPLKPFKVRDENMGAPTVTTGKTIHQRNKSSPALSSLMHAGALKAVAKRAAFADVSNTVRPPQPSKDDSTLSAKGTNDAVKGSIFPIQEAQKPAALLRPAQRPLSNMGPKSSADSITTIPEEGKHPVRRQTVSESTTRAVQATDNATKGAGKKNSMVFKDVSEIPKIPKLAGNTAIVSGLAAPVQQILPRSKTDVRADPTPSEQLPGAGEASAVYSSIEANPQPKLLDNGLVAQAVYVDAVESQEQSDTYDGIPSKAIAEFDYLADLESRAVELERARLAETTIDPQLPGVPDLEEWADEAGEPYYDDDYTTARSLKLRSDGNTTGGATIVLNPKVTARVERELAAAKEIVESSRTDEDIEDEAWDTSMVAEYGDEIFQYMTSLEVRNDRIVTIIFLQT